MYPALTEFDIDSIVEDNASPHNNADIRESHTRHGVNIVGYTATPSEKEHIKGLIRQQCERYVRTLSLALTLLALVLLALTVTLIYIAITISLVITIVTISIAITLAPALITPSPSPRLSR